MSLIRAIGGLISTTVARTARLDSSTHSFQIVDYAHHEIHSGSSYFNEQFIQVPNGDVLDIRFHTGNSTKWSHWLMHIITEGEFHITFYEDVAGFTEADQVSLTAKNRNRNSGNISNWQDFNYIINTNVGNANNDTDLTGATTLGTAATGSGRNKSGEGGHEEELVLKQNSRYVMRFENQSAAQKYVDYVMDWYEHTNKD
ncbi:MAG: hypothetical protein GY861_02790 [bacterium]|nr:hypothetical protein [bacterium]